MCSTRAIRSPQRGSCDIELLITDAGVMQVEDLSHSLGFRLADLAQQNTESVSNLNGTIDRILSSDDKLLASLQKLGYELDQQDPDEAKTADDLRETCMR